MERSIGVNVQQIRVIKSIWHIEIHFQTYLWRVVKYSLKQVVLIFDFFSVFQTHSKI